MPGYVLRHKNIMNAVICSVAACIFLIVQLVLMQRNIIAVVFDIIIPFTAAITFGCYAVTMAIDRPFILICPPMAYFISLLIDQLFFVEVGIGETYPVFTLAEIVPVIFYCVSVSLCRFKKLTDIVLKVFCGLIIATIAVLIVLALFFRVMLYPEMRRTFALAFGMAAILFIYIGMIEQLKIAGADKRPVPPLPLFKAPKN